MDWSSLLPGGAWWWVREELGGVVRERLAGSGLDDVPAGEDEVWRRVNRRLAEECWEREAEGATEAAGWRVRGLVLGKVGDVVADWHRKAERRRVAFGAALEAAGGDGEGGWEGQVLDGWWRREEGDPVAAVEAREEVRTLLEGLMELDGRTREVVWAWANKESQRRVAQRLGVTVRTVYTLRQRGIERLREHFRRRGYEVPSRGGGRGSGLASARRRSGPAEAG